MAVIKEFRCALHGAFDGTHPICPEMGCLSENVEREFRTPVSIGSSGTQRFDRGMRRTAEMMNISDWKRADRAGDSSFAGRGTDAPLGTQVLWGNEVAKHPEMGGRSFASLTQAAATPLTAVAERLGDKAVRDPYITRNNGMRATATTLGITQKVLPNAEITGEMKRSA